MAATILLVGCIPAGPVSTPDRVARDAGPRAAEPGLALELRDPPSARPAWEASPVVASSIVENGQRYHVVSSGETGIAIARAYGVPWSRIVDANRLSEPYVLQIGQRLVLPDPLEAATTTVEARARAFEVGIDDLVTGSEPARPAAVAAQTAPPATATSTAAASPTRFAWPASGPVVARFGKQRSGPANQGIDLKAANGVHAAASGTVAFVARDMPGFGGVILIRHEGNWITAYARITDMKVAKGAVVRGGMTIAGGVDDLLHFEIRRARVPVDPLAYLPRR